MEHLVAAHAGTCRPAQGVEASSRELIGYACPLLGRPGAPASRVHWRRLCAWCAAVIAAYARVRDDALVPRSSGLARALAAGVEISGAADHGVSEAVYFDDPDGNGVEIYRDRPEADWPRNPDGSLRLFNARLDLAALLAEA